MKNQLYIYFSLLLTLFARVEVSSQCPGVMVKSYGGAEHLLMTTTLEEKACEVATLLNIEAESSPLVHIYNWYPLQVFQNKLQGFEQLKNNVLSDHSNDPYYLIILKEHHDNGQLQYRSYLRLPDTAPIQSFNQIQRQAIGALVQQAIVNKGAESANDLGTSYLADIAGLEELKAIVSGEKSLDNSPELAGFETLEISGETSFVRTGSTLLGVDLNSTGKVWDYTGMEVSQGGSTPYEKMRELFAAASQSSSSLPVPGINWEYIFTDDLNSNLELEQAQANFEQATAKMIVWVHFQLEENSGNVSLMNIKTENNLTEAEVETIVDYYYQEELDNWITPNEEDPPVLRGAQPDLAKNLSCGFDWQWGKKCLMPKLGDNEFNGGIGCGLLDGLLGSIKFLYDTGEGLLHLVSGTFVKTTTYIWGLHKLLLKKNGVKNVLLKVYTDAGAVYERTKKKIIDAYTVVKEIITTLAPKWREIVQQVWQGVRDWMGELAQGTTNAGYDVGLIAFEVISAALSGGATAGSKSLPNLFDLLGDLENNAQGVVKKMLDTASSKVNEVAGLATKIFRCKILGKGCFVKDTPVLMANNSNQSSLRASGKAMVFAAAMPIVAVPIQEVQLLDYAVAHKTVNTGYGLTASRDDDIYLGLMDKDPYTSDQQRERDEYCLDDENWNEVVFEEVYGSSRAKLALHKDWISQKGYQVDAVIEMNLPEQGISGPFRITSIKHIIPGKRPEGDTGTGYDWKPVTGLFEHQSNQVYNINFDNGESLGVTYQHPLYSTTTGDWKLAGELEIGEEVLTKFGTTKVINFAKKEGSEKVYNLEVKELHNFLVSESGLLVHNACIPPIKPLLANMSQVFNDWVGAFTPIVRQATTDYYIYQQRVLGTLTERRIPLKKPHSFTKDNLDVDGFEPSTGTLIDTKYVGNPSASPYTGASTFPPIQDELVDELKRYKHIIDDPETPARDLKIVTNNEQAKDYLEDLMNSLNIPGGVLVIE